MDSECFIVSILFDCRLSGSIATFCRKKRRMCGVTFWRSIFISYAVMSVAHNFIRFRSRESQYFICHFRHSGEI